MPLLREECVSIKVKLKKSAKIIGRVSACNVIVPALSDEAKACLKTWIASVKSLQSRLGRSLDGMVGDLYFRILLKRSCCYLDWQRDVERTAPRFRISSLQE